MAFSLLLVIQWVRRVLSVFPLPDWTVSETVRLWAVAKLIPVLKEMAADTTTGVDDKIVAGLETFAADAKSWNSFYGLIVDLINNFGTEAVPGENDPTVLKLADDAKIDPAIIVAIITAVMELIKWWRDRNKEAT